MPTDQSSCWCQCHAFVIIHFWVLYGEAWNWQPGCAHSMILCCCAGGTLRNWAWTKTNRMERGSWGVLEGGSECRCLQMVHLRRTRICRAGRWYQCLCYNDSHYVLLLCRWYVCEKDKNMLGRVLKLMAVLCWQSFCAVAVQTVNVRRTRTCWAGCWSWWLCCVDSHFVLLLCRRYTWEEQEHAGRGAEIGGCHEQG